MGLWLEIVLEGELVALPSPYVTFAVPVSTHVATLVAEWPNKLIYTAISSKKSCKLFSPTSRLTLEWNHCGFEYILKCIFKMFSQT